MIVYGENFDGYEGVYQQFLNGFCGNSSPPGERVPQKTFRNCGARMSTGQNFWSK